jgi:ferric iron reductase protein FhuF
LNEDDDMTDDTSASASDGAQNLDHLFGEKFAYCHGKFLLGASHHDSISCRDLLYPDVCNGIFDRYAARFGGVDRRAAASMWTMYYFSGLVIGPVVAWRQHRRILPLSLDTTRISLDPTTSAPNAFVLGHDGHIDATASPSQALETAIFGHAAPVVEALAANAGLSRKLLWSNLVVYLDWIVREAATQMGEMTSAEELATTEGETWRDGRTNPVFGLIRRECSAEGDFSRRRVCCLRYILPGLPGCGMVCPLPAGRE